MYSGVGEGGEGDEACNTDEAVTPLQQLSALSSGRVVAPFFTLHVLYLLAICTPVRRCWSPASAVLPLVHVCVWVAV